MASYAKADIHGLPKDHTQHEAKKMCNKRSRSFQLSWKKTYPWLRFILWNLC